MYQANLNISTATNVVTAELQAGMGSANMPLLFGNPNLLNMPRAVNPDITQPNLQNSVIAGQNVITMLPQQPGPNTVTMDENGNYILTEPDGSQMSMNPNADPPTWVPVPPPSTKKTTPPVTAPVAVEE